MITRDDFRPAASEELPLKHGHLNAVDDDGAGPGLGRQPFTQEELSMVQPAQQDLPRRDRAVTYPTPEGPSRLGTVPTAPYGEDPHDPTTHAEPRKSSTGMIGRLHL